MIYFLHDIYKTLVFKCNQSGNINQLIKIEIDKKLTKYIN